MRRILIAAAIMLASCASPASTTGAPANLVGTHWMRVDDEDAAPHFATLNFEAERAAGFAGCNNWFATVTGVDERLSFGALGSTRMACPEPAMQTERNLFDALERTRSFRLDSDQLTFFDAAGGEVARFEATPPPTEP